MEFNPELVSGRDDDHNSLAEVIARFVDSDATVPEPTPNDWISDCELRELEKSAGQHLDRWAEFADVCRRAANLVDSPSGKALLLLRQLGGERRISPPTAAAIMAIANKVEALIQSLPDGAQRRRFDLLYDYHMGIVAREVTGDYLLAEELQKKSERKAVTSGDLVHAAISRLCIQVERFNHALSVSGDTASLFGPLHEAAAKVVEICVSETDERQIRWKYWNAPAHVFQAHIWSLTQVGYKYPLADLLFRWLPIFDAGHYKKMLPTIVSIEAGLAVLEDKCAEATVLAINVLYGKYGKPRDDGRVTALYLMEFLAGESHLEQVVDNPGIMHQLKRRAQAILDGRVPFAINSLD